jgi:hypothetical protein
MSNYTIAVAWNGKDALADTDASKVISGNDFDTEFTAVQVAVNSKANLNGAVSESFSATSAPAGTSTTQVATTAYVQGEFTQANINGMVYPVGSIYTATVSTNPSTLLGVGTWSAFGQGRVLIGAGTGTDSRSESKAFSAGSTSGAYNHQLTVAEMPSHNHSYVVHLGTGSSGPISLHDRIPQQTKTTGSTGGNGTHNNIQPYITVYMWKRTA